MNWRAAPPSRAARARSLSSVAIAVASDSASPGGTRRPVCPSTSASGVPPTRVATVGAPAAIDSSNTFESASLRERQQLQLVEIASLAGCSLANDQESCVVIPRLEDGCRFDQLLEPLQTCQPRDHHHKRRGRRNAEDLPKTVGITGSAELRKVD